MRYHLDTTFLVDWQREDPSSKTLRSEILARQHDVSIDPIVEAEFFAVPILDREIELVFDAVAAVGERLAITSEASRLAASWLGQMDKTQRLARFAHALVAAVAATNGATLLSNDTKIDSVFPVIVHHY